MPRGRKATYAAKQMRQARHIEEGHEKRGVGEKVAERRACATVNDQGINDEAGGAKKNGGDCGKPFARCQDTLGQASRADAQAQSQRQEIAS